VQVRASVVDHPDTRGGISPERGDAWAPEARQAARQSCRDQPRRKLTANAQPPMPCSPKPTSKSSRRRAGTTTWCRCRAAGAGMRCWMAAVITDGVKDQLQASTRGAISSCGHATYPDAHPARRRAPPTSCPRPDRPL